MSFVARLFEKMFGHSNRHLLKKYQEIAYQINALEPNFTCLSDDALKAKTSAFKQRLAEGETLDSLLPEAFATVREASRRVLKMRHFDVQLIGGMVLHDGQIAEMRTGEGKTLVSTLPAYLNALAGKGVHIVTVNDYLSKRDSQWMGQIHEFLGLSVGCIDGVHGTEAKKHAYECDITYGTNNEFGFDYLRDNLAIHGTDLVQRKPFFAIIDEVDSILIDEARTPLIISGPSDDKSDLYYLADEIVRALSPQDFDIEEESNSITLNDVGYDCVEKLLNEKGIEGMMAKHHLYQAEDLEMMHHIHQALRAHYLFSKNKDYIIKNDKLILIDEFTGRMMDGRRLSDGLHQALEAKEGVEIQPENQTLSSVTFQNYFRLYGKLSGMTGTAQTEAEELRETFGINVVQVPTHHPIARIDRQDFLYFSKEQKYKAITKEIKNAYEIGRPVLVGTASIERSEEISDLLKQENIPHQVLNARYHEQEAHIIAMAGRLQAITIATNMAGRGTDIQLGGSLEEFIDALPLEVPQDVKTQKIEEARQKIEQEKQQVLAKGGLYVIGTERHESRRIDNQLRGRAGRQGDKGESRFFLSLDDDLLRIFGGERLKNFFGNDHALADEAIENKIFSRAIERAQAKVEQKHYESRRQLMKYDNIINEQRTLVFARRKELVLGTDFMPIVHDMIEKFITEQLPEFCPERDLVDDWQIDGLTGYLNHIIGDHDFGISHYLQQDGVTFNSFKQFLIAKMKQLHADHIADWNADIVQDIHREYILRPMDFHWRHHLAALDRLGKMIGFRGYGQKDPLIEYKKEAFDNFALFLSRWRTESIGRVMQLRVEYTDFTQEEATDLLGEQNENITFSMQDFVVTPEMLENFPRNADCPCGSGEKFKHCHGKIE